jgi:small subunit ribosomal protein S6
VPQYEVTVIYEAGLAEDALEAQVESFKGFLTREGAELLEVQKWGKRRLGYELKKKREGAYVLFRVRGKPSLPQTVDRHLKFAEVVLRYLTIRVEARARAPQEKVVSGAAAGEAAEEGS